MSEYDREAINAIFDLSESLAEEKFLPFASQLDANEPAFIDGRVVIIDEVKEALDAYKEAGLFSTCFAQNVGGMQLPWMVHQGLNAMFVCANASVSSYVFLTQAAANMLQTCGSSDLVEKYFPKMLNGDWYGTMCLSEPQAGSSLSDIRTKAVPADDGSYRLSGSKM